MVVKWRSIRVFAFILLLVFIREDVDGQSFVQKDSAVIQPPTWEAGVDLLWLINKNNVPASGLFLRRTKPTSFGHYNAWRFRFGLDSEYKERKVVSSNLPTDSTFVIRPTLGIGREWGRKKGKYSYFYGVDLSGSYFRQKSDFFPLPQSDSILFNRIIKQFDIDINLLIGFKYQVTDNISLSIESHLVTSYTWFRYKEESGKFRLPPSGFVDDKSVSFLTQFRPIQVINLCYSFLKNKS